MKLQNSALALAAAGLLAACSATGELRADAVAQYHAGNLSHAGAQIEAAIADAHGSDTSISVSDWDMTRRDMPLLALERAMISLREGDVEGARQALLATRHELESRRIDSFTEFIGFQNVGDGVRQIFEGDVSLPFAAAGYEELAVYAMLMVTEALDSRQDLIPFAGQFGNAQNALLSSSYGINDEAFEPGDEHRVLAMGHYLEGVVREAGDNSSVALRPYQEAAALLPNSILVSDAVARIQNGDPRSEFGEGVLHVLYLLGRGPELGSSNFNIEESDPIVEFLGRVMLQVLDILRETAGGDSYEWEDAVLLQLTTTPIPVPYVIGNGSQFGPVTASVPSAGIQADGERLVDFYELAEARIRSERWMILTRSVIRRFVKQSVAQEVGGGWGALASLGSQLFEKADTRSWGTLPAEVRVARLTLPTGVHQVDLGIETVSIEQGIEDSFIVVIISEPGGPATILVDAYSYLELGGVLEGTAEATASGGAVAP